MREEIGHGAEYRFGIQYATDGQSTFEQSTLYDQVYHLFLGACSVVAWHRRCIDKCIKNKQFDKLDMPMTSRDSEITL